MPNLLNLLGLGATAGVQGQTARLQGQQQGLMDRLALEDREMQRRMQEAEIGNLESLTRARNAPVAPTRREPIYDRERGGFVDPETGTFTPISGLPAAPSATQKPRLQVQDGQVVNLDDATARPIQGYTPPPPTVRQSMPTEGERKAAAFYASGKKGYDTLEGLLGEEGQEVPGFWAQTAQRVGLGAGNVMTNQQVRQMRQAALMLSDAWLRYTSGAAVPEQEVERFAESFIPRAGDDAATLQQKKEARATIIEALRQGAGRALDPNAQGTAPSVAERYQLEMP